MKLNLKLHFPRMIILDSHHERSIQILAWKHLVSILVINNNYIFLNHLTNWQEIFFKPSATSCKFLNQCFLLVICCEVPIFVNHMLSG
jgi:hypothetical protein